MSYGYQQNFLQRHWKKMCSLMFTVIVAGLFYGWGLKAAGIGAGVMIGGAFAIVVLGSFISFLGGCWQDLQHWLLQKKIERNSGSKIAPELNRMIRRVLAREKIGYHNAKTSLVNMLFGEVPATVFYRVVNYNARAGDMHRVHQASKKQMIRVLGPTHKIQVVDKSRFNLRIEVKEPTRFVPQFSLEDGTTFVVYRVECGNDYLDFEDRETNVSFGGEVPHRVSTSKREPQLTTSKSRLDHALN